jgi:hypothetical protein
MTDKLKFGKGNAKLGKNIYTFSLPSGYSCPFAMDCLSKAERTTGKIKDGPQTKFRCFSASQESLYPSVRKQRWYNYDALRAAIKSAEGTDAKYYGGSYAMSELILDSLPANARIVRIHVGGDFFSVSYMRAWAIVATMRPDVVFYAYTKSLRYWVALRAGSLHPDNLVLTASYGGSEDSLIAEHDLRYAKVVFSEDEAKTEGLPIDHDDSHAMVNGPSFALLIHGTQPKGSEAGKALAKLRKQGKGGYSRKRKAVAS